MYYKCYKKYFENVSRRNYTMKSPRNRKVLVLIGILTVIGIVLSSIVFEVKPLASENPQTMEERTLFDDSIFESEVSSEVSKKLPTSAQAVL